MMNPTTISPESSSASANLLGLSAKGKKGKSGSKEGLFSRLLVKLQHTATQEGKQSKDIATTTKSKLALSNAKAAPLVVKVNTSAHLVTLKSNAKTVLTTQVTTDKVTASKGKQPSAAHLKLAQTLLSHATTAAKGVKTAQTELKSEQVANAAKKSHLLITAAKSEQQKSSEAAKEVIATVQEAAFIKPTPLLKNSDHEKVSLDATTTNPKNKKPALVSNQINQQTIGQQDTLGSQLGEANKDKTVKFTNILDKNQAVQADVKSNAQTTQAVLADGKSNMQTTQAVLADGKSNVQPTQAVLADVNLEEKALVSRTEKNGTSDAAQSDSLKSQQSPIAVLQQRSPNQANNQHVTASVAQESNAQLNNKVGESSSASSGQDFASNQDGTDQMFLDTGKGEARISKGLDFQAQLAYKSQRSFTPGDAMLEVIRSAKDGTTSLELQLEPANLGKVIVNVQLDAAKQLQVSFTVEHAASRHALEQQMPQLRLALAQQGLDLGSFNMQMNQQQQQGNQQQGSGSAHRSETDIDNMTTTL
ncbi:MAG: flagellar hook-length control protein FliK, partial [Ghiorsea sp.]